jgi:hypothetical protein
MSSAEIDRPAAATAERVSWRFLISRRWLGWHLCMVVCVLGMLALGYWQYRRAMEGNALSWAYTFEWPMFAIFAVVFWAKTIRDEFRIRRGEIPRVQNRLAAEPDLPLTVAAVQSYTSASTELEVYDPELAAYNAYLSRLNSEVKDHGKWHGLR